MIKRRRTIVEDICLVSINLPVHTFVTVTCTFPDPPFSFGLEFEQVNKGVDVDRNNRLGGSRKYPW